jgi:hypothetical protein
VKLAMQGRRLSGKAWAVTERAEVESALGDLIAAQPSYATFAEVGRPPYGSLDIAGTAGKRVLIRASIEPAA